MLADSLPAEPPGKSCLFGDPSIKKRTSPGRGPGVGICHRNSGKNDGGLVLVMVLRGGGWILVYLEVELAGFAETLDVR